MKEEAPLQVRLRHQLLPQDHERKYLDTFSEMLLVRVPMLKSDGVTLTNLRAM